MIARMVRIETRRNAALWLCPLMVVLALLLQSPLRWSELMARLLLWAEASKIMHDTVYIIGPVVAGAAAWMGGRERRRHIEDLLVTTPHPAWTRRMVTWTATTMWALLAYFVVIAVVAALTLMHAVWGGPVLWPVLVGVAALPACAAIGYALGAFLPSRFTAPFAVIVVFMALFIVGPGLNSSQAPRLAQSLSYLSPATNLDWSVWYGARPDVGLPQMLFLLGVTGVALGSLVLRSRRDRADRAAWAVLLAGFLLGGAGIGVLVATAPVAALVLGQQQRYGAPIPYTPVCTTTPVTVCVHPAYRPWLARDAAIIARLMAPLRGVPGAPMRAEQRPDKTIGYDLEGVYGQTLTFVPNSNPMDQQFFGQIAYILVNGDLYLYRSGYLPHCPGDPSGRLCSDTQGAIDAYLLNQAGLRLTPVTFGNQTPTYPYFGSDWAVASAAARRFAALPSAQRQAWLHAHYRAVTQQRVPLKDLP